MKFFAAAFSALVFALPFAASADVSSDVHFGSDGSFTATGLTIFQKSGADFYTRAIWGLAFVRIVVLPNASTTITKAHGEPATLADIQEKDIIDVTGTLISGADSIMILPSTIRDTNLQSAGKTVSGTVKSINFNAQTFVLTNASYGNTTVQLSSGAQITKGQRTIYLADLAVGDKILSTTGTYDYPSNTLTANSITVYQNPAVFTPANFQGTLKSIAGTTLPTSAVITVSGTDYTVYLAASSSILNNAKAKASLSRFVVGDTVRLYGAIRPTNLTQIDASILRDLNF